MEPLAITIDELKADIVVLSEHSLRNNEIERLNLDNFQINAFFCRENFRKGVCLF